jgi:hypothetical protein
MSGGTELRLPTADGRWIQKGLWLRRRERRQLDRKGLRSRARRQRPTGSEELRLQRDGGSARVAGLRGAAVRQRVRSRRGFGLGEASRAGRDTRALRSSRGAVDAPGFDRASALRERVDSRVGCRFGDGARASGFFDRDRLRAGSGEAYGRNRRKGSAHFGGRDASDGRDGSERGPTSRGDRRRKRRTATRQEQSSEGCNPMSGSGMKQGRQARGGSKGVERSRKPEGASGRVWKARPTKLLLRAGRR